MQTREALRDLQARLSERLQTQVGAGAQAQWLAVQAGAQPCLLPMRQVGEIFSATPATPVPYARPWFLGVANLRGGLYGVAELARLLQASGLAEAAEGAIAAQARDITLNPDLECNAALRIDALLGMRRADAYSSQAAVTHPWVVARWTDAQQHTWLELDLRALAVSPDFLTVVG